MKIETALRYAHEVARRVRAVNGLLATPVCAHEAVRISRIWVFGSTVKGSRAPNDLDLLIEMKDVGRRYGYRQTTVDKQYLRSYGMRSAPRSRSAALKWLTKGMRNVSRHVADTECVEIDVKILIYPRNDLVNHVASANLSGAPKSNRGGLDVTEANNSTYSSVEAPAYLSMS